MMDASTTWLQVPEARERGAMAGGLPSDEFTAALERCRGYLSLLASMQVGDAFRGKIDSSAIVQQTLFEAHRHRDDYKGRSERELAGWLRRIMACRLADAMRVWTKSKRDARRERSLQAEMDASSARLEKFLVDEHVSPSQDAVHKEQVLIMAEKMAELTEAQREAILLRYCQNWSVAQIAEHMNCASSSVVRLLMRGTTKLRQLVEK